MSIVIAPAHTSQKARSSRLGPPPMMKVINKPKELEEFAGKIIVFRSSNPYFTFAENSFKLPEAAPGIFLGYIPHCKQWDKEKGPRLHRIANTASEYEDPDIFINDKTLSGSNLTIRTTNNTEVKQLIDAIKANTARLTFPNLLRDFLSAAAN